MSNSLNLQLTHKLRSYIDERASDHDVYATPSEYIRDLIRRDMQIQNQNWNNEVATILLRSKKSPTLPLEDNFFDEQIARIKIHSEAP